MVLKTILVVEKLFIHRAALQTGKYSGKYPGERHPAQGHTLHLGTDLACEIKQQDHGMEGEYSVCEPRTISSFEFSQFRRNKKMASEGQAET